MSEDLFTDIYLDEGISPIFARILRKNGFSVRTSEELNSKGFSDEQHLNLAIALKRTLITVDKNTFVVDSKALEKKHFGIITITKQFSRTNAASAALQFIDKFLNKYTKDEWQNLIVNL